MSEELINAAAGGSFHLDKWFLDFAGEGGEAMIFYAAKLSWHGWSVSYTSWLRYDEVSGVRLRSGFRRVQMPKLQDTSITWSDAKFGVSGIWEATAAMIQTRLFDAEEGYLDWKCFQPASRVKLRINGIVLEGRGYAEQLILTALPWKIPMNELRWGHFGSDNHTMVWVELKEKDQRQWLWLNGERVDHCLIEDGQIVLPERGLVLKLDRSVLLESEKKIFSVVEKLVRYLPGFNKMMPLHFLMADETKWLSRGQLQVNRQPLSNGPAIHELVNFKTLP